MKDQNKITYRSLDELKPWERNYRKGNVEAIVASIRQFGFIKALAVWRGSVMAGNHAFRALVFMRIAGDSAPRNVIDDGSRWMVPTIDISHLTEVQAEAFAVADNRTQELGSVEKDLLASVLTDIGELNMELLTATGFSEFELDQLLESLEFEKPSFEAVDKSTQPELDKQKLAVCPNCGHEFAPCQSD